MCVDQPAGVAEELTEGLAQGVILDPASLAGLLGTGSTGVVYVVGRIAEAQIGLGLAEQALNIHGNGRVAAPIPDIVTLHVPFRVARRGGRKEIQLPTGAIQPRRTDNTLLKALARAFRWKRMLESGEFATIAELAEREGIPPSYMTRILRLTLLAPEIVEEILDGKQGPEVTLARLLEPFPIEWENQINRPKACNLIL